MHGLWHVRHLALYVITAPSLRNRCVHSRVTESKTWSWGQKGSRERPFGGPVAGAWESHAVLFCCFRKAIHVFSTAEGLLTQDDRVTAHGLQEVFATNVFGHFVLVSAIRPPLSTGVLKAVGTIALLCEAQRRGLALDLGVFK